ncbi:MAG: citramalate synthase [Pseudomonadota bacterium]
MEPIFLYDTTLRDGTQGESINFSAQEKIRIAKRLDQLGVQYIEGGWPGSNPRDMQFFELARDTPFVQARITAFGATRRPGITPAEDENLQALLNSGTQSVAVVGKSWDLHVEIMNNSLEENLNMIRESILYLKDHGREVIYDAEHFFDGYKANPDYTLSTLEAALKAGADFLVLCDTNGGTLHFEIESIFQTVQRTLQEKREAGSPVRLGIHAHNDCASAVANSISAVNAGAVMVQGTINGYGERCGNADLTAIIPILCCKMNRPCIVLEKVASLKKISRFVSEMANMTPLDNRPFVGRSAFAHKGGIHVSAIAKQPRAYEHMDPAVVGNSRRVLVSDMSGKTNVEYKARELGVSLNGNGMDSRKIVNEIKRLEQEGFQFDVADGSLKILLQKLTGQFNPLFTLENYRISMEKDKDQHAWAHAITKVSVEDRKEIIAAEGEGPVNALDNALRKVLKKFYPHLGLDALRLVDYKVRVIDGRDATAAKVRVIIDSRDHEDIWTTIGVSTDIIEASWQALCDSFQYKLAKDLLAAESNPASEGL